MSSLEFLEYTSKENIPCNKIYSLIHSCKKCRYITKSLFFIRKHIRRHKSATPLEPFECSKNTLEIFLCKECNFQTYETVAFNNHIKNHHLTGLQIQTEISENLNSHRPRKPESCNESLQCGESSSFSSDDFLQRQIITLNKSELKTNAKKSNLKWFTCDTCLYKTQEEKYLESHVCRDKRKCKSSEHTTELVEKINKTKFKAYLESHMLNKHTLFQCEKCTYKAKCKYHLKRHMLYKHTPEKHIKWFNCDTCLYKCKVKDDLKKHVNGVHRAFGDIKRFKCNLCSYKAKIKRGLMLHVLMQHTDSQNITWFHCDRCIYKAKWKSDLNKHMIKYHTHPENKVWHHCNRCTYKTRGKDSLEIHIIRKHPPKELKATPSDTFDCSRNTLQIFLCKECNFQTYEAFIFNNHIKDHHILRQFTEADLQNQTEISETVNSQGLHTQEPCNESSQCGESNSFSSDNSLQRQIIILDKSQLKVNTKRSNLKWFACDTCLYKTQEEKYLETHVCRDKRKCKSNLSVDTTANCEAKQGLEKHVNERHASSEDVKLFKCNVCSYKAERKYQLERHILYKHTLESDVKWFNCDKCLYKCKEKADLKKHVRAIHITSGNSKWLKCHVCSYRTELKFDLRRHIINRHRSVKNIKSFQLKTTPLEPFDCSKNTLEIFLCKECNFQTYESVAFNNHIKDHRMLSQFSEADVQNLTQKCENVNRQVPCTQEPCSESSQYVESSSFSTDDLLQRQIITLDKSQLKTNTKKSNLKWFACDTCLYKTQEEKYLETHVCKDKRKCKSNLRVHTTKNVEKSVNQQGSTENINTKNWFHCDQCFYKTKLRTSLNNHMMKYHSHPENLVWHHCNMCAYKAREKYTLKVHIIRRHLARELTTYECEKCTYKTKWKYQLKRHMLYNHTLGKHIKWFNCGKCSCKFKAEDGLKKHARVHTVSRDIKWFECNVCLFKAKRKPQLERHMLYKHTLESDVKWFICDICLYKCKEKGVLKKHLRAVHTTAGKIKRLKCHVCSYRTKSKFYLRRHIIRQHASVRNIKWFHCDQCLYTAKLRTSLNKHMMKHHSHQENKVWHHCDKCSFKTRENGALNVHCIRMHSPDELKATPLESSDCSKNTLEIFLCKECNFQTYDSVAFNNHVEDHRLLRQFTEADMQNQTEISENVNRQVPCTHVPCSESSQYGESSSFSTDDLLQRQIITLDKNQLKKYTKKSDLKWFACDTCLYKTQEEKYLESHVCRDKRKSNSNLSVHTTKNVDKSVNQRRSVEIKWFRCKQCSYKAKLRTTLNKHIMEHHSHLEKEAKEERTLKVHNIRKHSPKELETDLNNHIIKIHTDSEDTPTENIKVFQCEKCTHKTKWKHQLKRHMLYKHTLEKHIKWFDCDKCSYKFKVREDLKKHVNAMHTAFEDIKWFKCNLCSYKAKLKSNLNKHLIRHHEPEEDIEWFYCDHCMYKAKRKFDLNYHMVNYHTRPEDAENTKLFQCEKCTYKANQKSHLDRHIINKHTLERHIRWFNCDECSYNCKENGDLKKHVIWKHTDPDNIKWFNCHVCSYKSKKNCVLKKHIINRHTPEENI